jgi:hypothetical protein
MAQAASIRFRRLAASLLALPRHPEQTIEHIREQARG